MKDTEFSDLIERVREQTDIVQVIGRHIKLDKHHKALCPFHDERDPSFSVNPLGQYFYCFGCGVGGDVFRFIELHEDMSFMEVLEHLAQQAGIPVPAVPPEARQRIADDRTIEEILAETASFYHNALTSEATAYLTGERHFRPDTISRFQIGFANGGLQAHLLDDCRFSPDLCLRAGVLTERDGRPVSDYFHGRIVFPNLRRGRVVHLSGRSLNGRAPKYLHLRGPMRYLYNEDALANKEVCIVEGVPDCLSAVQAGYPAVAVLGTSNFKPEYLPRFSGCETVYLCFDADEVGNEAALSIGEYFGQRARIVTLPEGLDLNDYLRQHPKEEFQALLAEAPDIIKYKLHLIPADIDRTQLARMLDSTLKDLARLDEPTAEAYLRHELKPRFGLTNPEIDKYRKLLNDYRKDESTGAQTRVTAAGVEPVPTALFEGLVDIVEHDDVPAFLVKNEGGLSIEPEVERDGVVYVPPERQQIPWLLPGGEHVLDLCGGEGIAPDQSTDEALYADLLNYHKSVSELPGDEYYDLLVAWDFHTYRLEAVQYSPIICLFAVPERGKSRTGKGMIHVAYRGIHVESLRDAYLVRVANDLHASLFFDVKDIWYKAEKNGSEDILLHRFEKGAKVPRVLYPDRGAHRDIVYYSTFGPTVVATNEEVHRILETRAIHVNMPEGTEQFETNVTPELALPLKERLVAFRARYLAAELADIPKPATGRLGDILKPLQQIIRLVKPDREATFLNLVRELHAERLTEKAASLEAEILGAVVDLSHRVERRILPVKTITDTLNEARPEKSRLSYQKVGRRLKAMGFRKERTSSGASAIVWDDRLIERMKDAYGLGKRSETSETPETPDSASDVTAVSDDTDVFQL